MDVDSVSPHLDTESLPRKTMVINVPTPRLNHDTGLVELRLEKFEYSYRAQVSPTKFWLSTAFHINYPTQVDENNMPLPEDDQVSEKHIKSTCHF
jgi:hypothetical protein